MEKLAEYLRAEDASAELQRLAASLGVQEFARVRNLDFIFAPYELYPLAPRVVPPLPHVAAFAVDMDGTSTTTEPLALHALEYMVRRITGRLTPADWPGLDAQLDHPHVIGNSNFRHTEFLIGRYRTALRPDAFAQSFIEALTWTLACMPDAQRRRDVQQNARNSGLGELLEDAEFRRVTTAPDAPAEDSIHAESVGRLAAPFVHKYGRAFHPRHLSDEVATALDIYYMRYHAVLRELERGQGERLARELLGAGGDAATHGTGSAVRQLVEPMPGYDVFLPLVKGWLGAEIDALYEPLREALRAHPELGYSAAQLDGWRPRLGHLAAHFARRPAKVALVTASIAYETHACMREVIRVVAERVQHWPVPAEVRDRIAAGLADYRAVFEGFVCASDVWEARLKPHRDLYSRALFQMSIPRAEYPLVVGLEDTEPGIIALRAAGVGCAVALPNHDTRRQDYSAAIDVVRGGLPELILARNLLIA